MNNLYILFFLIIILILIICAIVIQNIYYSNKIVKGGAIVDKCIKIVDPKYDIVYGTINRNALIVVGTDDRNRYPNRPFRIVAYYTKEGHYKEYNKEDDYILIYSQEFKDIPDDYKIPYIKEDSALILRDLYDDNDTHIIDMGTIIGASINYNIEYYKKLQSKYGKEVLTDGGIIRSLYDNGKKIIHRYSSISPLLISNTPLLPVSEAPPLPISTILNVAPSKNTKKYIKQYKDSALGNNGLSNSDLILITIPKTKNDTKYLIGKITCNDNGDMHIDPINSATTIFADQFMDIPNDRVLPFLKKGDALVLEDIWLTPECPNNIKNLLGIDNILYNAGDIINKDNIMSSNDSQTKYYQGLKILYGMGSLNGMPRYYSKGKLYNDHNGPHVLEQDGLKNSLVCDGKTIIYVNPKSDNTSTPESDNTSVPESDNTSASENNNTSASENNNTRVFSKNAAISVSKSERESERESERKRVPESERESERKRVPESERESERKNEHINENTKYSQNYDDIKINKNIMHMIKDSDRAYKEEFINQLNHTKSFNNNLTNLQSGLAKLQNKLKQDQYDKSDYLSDNLQITEFEKIRQFIDDNDVTGFKLANSHYTLNGKLYNKNDIIPYDEFKRIMDKLPNGYILTNDPNTTYYHAAG